MSLQLPDKLYFGGSYDEIIDELHKIFLTDIKKHDLRYQGLPIVFDNRRDIEYHYEEGFWHIITRGKGDRSLDFKRAKRLPWLKPIIENHNNADILLWIEEDTDKKGKRVTKTYFWYKNGKYLIVLTEKPNRYFLATAFYVNSGRNEQYYWKRYQNAQKDKKKGPGY